MNPLYLAPVALAILLLYLWQLSKHRGQLSTLNSQLSTTKSAYEQKLVESAKAREERVEQVINQAKSDCREIRRGYEQLLETHVAAADQLARKLTAARAELSTLNAQLSTSPRTIPAARGTALKDDAFQRIWRDWPADDERYLAVHQLLALETVDAIERAADPRLAGKPEATHAAGGLEMLLTLSANLDACRARPEQWTRRGKEEVRRQKEEN